MGIDPKPFLEISINRGEIHPVIQGYQHKGDDQITEQVAQHHLEIKKVAASHAAGNTHESDTAERSADHTKGHQHPVAVAVTDEKRFVVGVPGSKVCHTKQQQEIADHKREQQKGRHRQLFTEK